MSTDTKDETSQVKEAVAFVAANSTIGENGKRAGTKAAFFDYMKSQGIPKAQVEAVGRAESNYISAAVHVAADDLKGKIEEARAAGNDPKDLRSEVSLPTASGRIVTSVTAHSLARVPRTGETIPRIGGVKVQIAVGGAIKKPAAEYARDLITAAMA